MSRTTVNGALLLWIWLAFATVATFLGVLRNPLPSWNPGGIAFAAMVLLLAGSALLLHKFGSRFGPVSLVVMSSTFAIVAVLSIPFTMFALNRPWWHGIAWVAGFWLPFSAIRAIRSPERSDAAT